MLVRSLAMAVAGCNLGPDAIVVPTAGTAPQSPEPTCPYVGAYNVVADANWETATINLDAGCRITLNSRICELSSEEISVAETGDGSWVGQSHGWRDCDGRMFSDQYPVELAFVVLTRTLRLEFDALATFTNGDEFEVPDLTLTP